ncbi:hypothetical protein A5658_01715 [Mycobacterium sp. 1245111.1]|uniref:MCE family protein n=1 Tax=Mycobacterium sp. 1245111.1 TaxID=1834073 RepID=UPI0007FB74A3|nr:MlaD family protein [Mycobacterium sp. 1245111.1]OBK33389.1 hypothetical protein A5658_01715 [Mycobacterium sp. 1245111.1]
MLTRLVRIQLVLFTIASIVGLTVMVFTYLKAPMLLGVGRITVTVDLPDTGGLYRFSNVTYRGVQVGKVTAVRLTHTGAKATLSLGTSPRIPADLHADVRSISAIGEQYVDLLPRKDAPPYLHNGSVIAAADTTIPQDVGPLLNQTSALIDSIPKEKLGQLLDESFRAFNGAGYNLSSLADSSAKLSADFAGVADRGRDLVRDSAPIVDALADSTAALHTWAHSLAGVTGQLVSDDPALRTVLRTGPGALEEASRLLEQLKPTLPVLLGNLTSLGQVLVTYRPDIEQVLVLFPPFMANLLSEAGDHNPTGVGQGDFSLNIGDPPACTVGYLPPNQWRSPADTSIVDTPKNLYCKLPQDSPLAVRGARNYPCMAKPGKRAPTVEICDSDRPYEPLAMREHVYGPYPLDPNLLAQGVPPDDRATSDGHIFGPREGTPPGPPAPGAPAPPERPAPPGPPPPSATGASTPAAPSEFRPGDSGRQPSFAFAQYDPGSGKYLTPDGHTYRRSDLAAGTVVKTWKDMLLRQNT